MPRSVAEIATRIEETTRPRFRGRLLARGFARNLIWKEGKLPEGARPFSELLTSDLLAYGLALFRLGLELRAQVRHHEAALNAFGRVGEAIESVVRDGDPNFNERGFYFVVAAAAYHLGHFSARAFSLLPSEVEALNLSPCERALKLLMRRDLGQLRQILRQFSDAGGFDENLEVKLGGLGDEPDFEQAIYLSLESAYHRALALFDFALDRGSSDLVQEALIALDEGIATAAEFRSVPFWWIFTITRHLLDDLWDQSFHVRLPVSPKDGPDQNWETLRSLFIASLLRRNRSEVELWPSQLDAAARAVDMNDDLVAALPTSAGKTRIAEICILRALSAGKRVVFVTPLRALSAQTERALRQIFVPLGFSVSSLYGSSGSTGDDVDSLKNRDIVVSTPEKLDFALRNDPELLETVGLIVLDEAHTIGAGEREVRYEVLVQRLLRRSDAGTRRIVCLSAILPHGDQLADFVSWIRQDQAGDALTVNWRPTRQRFGEIFWAKSRAILSFRVDGASEADAPYVDPFVSILQPRGRQRKTLPRDRRDLSLMSAWRLVEEGQTVLLYCPERRRVIPLAECALDLVSRGYLPKLFDGDKSLLRDALNIGREWLGDNHPAVQCLSIGVAVHHGQLPRPFLRAVERLLKDRVLKVTIASPTLAQGLNLSATTVLFGSLNRGQNLISGEEFANVAGRAGRAFVDVEGKVLCVAWERKHLGDWDRLLQASRARSLKSGLLQLIIDFCTQISVRKNLSIEKTLEYVMGNADVWKPPRPKTLATDDEKEEQEEFERKWERDLACLDSALLSLIQHDVDLADVAAALDDALKSSLWERSLARENEITQRLSKLLLRRRAGFIWKNSTARQRKGYFFAGVSFTTGEYLDKHSDELNARLKEADDGCAEGNIEKALKAIKQFALLVFEIEPFKPDELLENWEEILEQWVHGNSMSDLAGGKDAQMLEFIEGALVYRLVWAMEAVRVRQMAEDEDVESPNAGRAALAIETGTADFCAAIIIQAGLSSRIAAMKAIADCPADFEDIWGLKRWLRSREVRQHEAEPEWPTKDTASLWRLFVEGFESTEIRRWSIQDFENTVEWSGPAPDAGFVVRVMYDADTKSLLVFSPDLTLVGHLPQKWEHEPAGVIWAEVSKLENQLSIRYLGPRDLFAPEPA